MYLHIIQFTSDQRHYGAIILEPEVSGLLALPLKSLTMSNFVSVVSDSQAVEWAFSLLLC